LSFVQSAFGVPALAGKVLPADAGLGHSAIHGAITSYRLKPGLQTLDTRRFTSSSSSFSSSSSVLQGDFEDEDDNEDEDDGADRSFLTQVVVAARRVA